MGQREAGVGGKDTGREHHGVSTRCPSTPLILPARCGCRGRAAHAECLWTCLVQVWRLGTPVSADRQCWVTGRPSRCRRVFPAGFSSGFSRCGRRRAPLTPRRSAGSTADGKLQPGDQLLMINSSAVDGLSVERAASLIRCVPTRVPGAGLRVAAGLTACPFAGTPVTSCS